MTYRVRIFPRAEADIEHIFQWISQRSPLGALRWYAAFDDAAARLVTDPLSAGLARENEFVEHEIRQILFKTPRGRLYRCLFTVTGNEVRLLRVRGPGQRDLQRDELDEGQ